MANPREKREERTRDEAVSAEERLEISRTNRADDPLVLQLQRQLANAFVLHSSYKRCQWQCHGPLFRDQHLLFQELAAAVLGTVYELAERIRMIGQDPLAGPSETLERASVTPAALGSMRQMIEAADAQLIRVIREMREAVDTASAARDPGSAELLARLVQIHEKHEWWLRDLLERDDQVARARVGEGRPGA